MSILGTLTGLDGLADMAKSIGNDIATVAGKLIPDATTVKQLQAASEQSITDALAARFQAQATVMTADSQSDSWLTRNMRPFVVLWGLGTMTATMVFSYFGKAAIITGALAAVPDPLWTLVTTGIGIYAGGRTLEKVATTIAGAIKR